MSTSAVAPADWLAMQESLLRGFNHALSNRLASLHAITMLTEGVEKLDPKMHQALVADVEQLSELLTDYRALLSDPAPRRDPARLGDALGRAAGLLVHHPECRDVEFAAPDEDALAEPVALLGKDALRAGLLLLLPVARGGGKGARVEVSVRGADGHVHVTARSSKAVSLRESAELAALSRFAELEGGNAKASPGGDAIELTLPGLSRARNALG